MHILETLGRLMLAASLAAWSSLIAAQTWPVKPVKLIIPFAPGGPQEIPLRPVSVKLTEVLGQPVIIDFKPGAAAIIGTDFVAKSAPDGYTLIWGTVSSHAINMTLYTKVRYDNIKDFAPITQLFEQPLMVVVPMSSRIANMGDLTKILHTRSMKLSVASPSVGSSGHMINELIKKRTGGDMTHIGYKGSNPMLTDLVGGHIDLGVDNLPSSLALVKSGKLRALAVTSSKRSTLAPDVPTLNEFLPGLEAVAWQGLFAPAGTPDAILERLEREVTAILKQPDVIQSMSESGTFPVGNSRIEFASFVKSETAKWAEIVKASGARSDE